MIKILVLSGIGVLYCQDSKKHEFKIQKGTNCATTLEKFKEKFHILLAYSPTLESQVALYDKSLIGDSVQDLLQKICSTFQLEYGVSGQNAFLVRTDADAIKSSEDKVVHFSIQDASDGSPVAFAAVYDESKQYFAFTDAHGDCFIKIPKSLKGTDFYVHSLSYSDKKITTNRDLDYHQIRLASDPVNVLPVMINSVKKKISFLGGQGIQADSPVLDKISTSSIFQKDILRNIQFMPGINAINDSKSGVRIRGANEDATLLMIDNMPVYKADHFYGVFGAFNSFYVKKITLFKNNIPVEYGGRTSGMVKMESDANPKVFNVNLDLNLLNSGVMVDLPITNRFTLKLSGRKSYTNLLNTGLNDLSQRDNIAIDSKPKDARNIIVSRPRFDFYDQNTRLIYKIGRQTLDANIFMSGDKFNDKYNISFKGKQMSMNEEKFSQVNTWRNRIFGLNYNYSGQKYDISGTLYSTTYSCNYNILSNLTKRTPGSISTDTVTIFNDNVISDKGVKLVYKSNLGNKLLFGAEYIHHENGLNIVNDKQPVYEINRTGVESSVFSSVSLGKDDIFRVEPSARLTFLPDLVKTFFLPQIYAKAAIDDDTYIKASAGRQVQLIRLFEHENLLGQKQQFFAMSNGKSIPVGLGQNFMAGIWKSFGSLTLDIESYYRTLDGAIIHVTQSPGLRMPAMSGLPPMRAFRLFSGDSRSFGTDISLIYDRKDFFSMVTYTLSKTENRFKEIFGNQFFPSSDDTRHQLKWVNTVTLSHFEFSLNYVAASGRPYLDLSSLPDSADRTTLNINNYIKNLSAYHRIDIGTSYKFKLYQQQAKLTISVFNLLDRINVKYRQFVYQLPPPPNAGPNPVNTILGSDISQLNRTLNISFNVSIH